MAVSILYMKFSYEKKSRKYSSYVSPFSGQFLCHCDEGQGQDYLTAVTFSDGAGNDNDIEEHLTLTF